MGEVGNLHKPMDRNRKSAETHEESWKSDGPFREALLAAPPSRGTEEVTKPVPLPAWVWAPRDWDATDDLSEMLEQQNRSAT